MRRVLLSCILAAAACTADGPAGSSAPDAPAARPDAAVAPRRAPAAAPNAPVDLTLGSGDDPCAGEIVMRGGQRFLELDDGTLIAMAPMTVTVAGAKDAFHPDNAAGGALLHRCNAGEVFLPGGTAYEGAASPATCTGRFEEDAARIESAGWDDPQTGAIRWHGITAQGSARISGARVPRVEPVLQADGSGFYVSRTGLQDTRYAPDDARRFVDSGEVPYAALRRDQGVPLGTFGVAYRTRGCPYNRDCEPVPFIVADHAPRAGFGSMALARAVSGLPPEEPSRENRYDGEARRQDVLTVFFGGAPAGAPYTSDAVRERAAEAFEAWGGTERLSRCRRRYIPEAG